MGGKKLKTNQKALAARERKANVKAGKKSANAKAQDDAAWADSGNSAKEKKKREAERKRQEQLAKKEALRKLKEKDQAEAAAAQRKKNFKPRSKVTAAEVNKRAEEKKQLRALQVRQEEAEKNKLIYAPEELQENTNLIIREQEEEDKKRFGEANVVTAGDIETALSKMEGPGGKQKGPKMKELFGKFSERRMAELKAEGGLKLSQMKDQVWKEWQRSPENPMRNR
jgi:hypothetical protein